MTQLTAGDKKTGVLMTVRVNQIRNGTTMAEQEEQLQAALPTLEQRFKVSGSGDGKFRGYNRSKS